MIFDAVSSYQANTVQAVGRSTKLGSDSHLFGSRLWGTCCITNLIAQSSSIPPDWRLQWVLSRFCVQYFGFWCACIQVIQKRTFFQMDKFNFKFKLKIIDSCSDGGLTLKFNKFCYWHILMLLTDWITDGWTFFNLYSIVKVLALVILHPNRCSTLKFRRHRQ